MSETINSTAVWKIGHSL